MGYDVDERVGHSGRVIWLLVAGLFAGICYSLGFNAGCEEGEGRLWRRQLERTRDAAHVQQLADGALEFATVPAQMIDADEPAQDATGEHSAGVELFADVLGQSVPPAIAARGAHEEAY